MEIQIPFDSESTLTQTPPSSILHSSLETTRDVDESELLNRSIPTPTESRPTIQTARVQSGLNHKYDRPSRFTLSTWLQNGLWVGIGIGITLLILWLTNSIK